MKIFLPDGSRASRTIYVQPGNHRNERPEWFISDGRGGFEMDANGKKRALVFPVKFTDGAAEVEKHLGKYMLDEKLAQKTQGAQPKVEAPIVVDERVRPQRRVYTSI